MKRCAGIAVQLAIFCCVMVKPIHSLRPSLAKLPKEVPDPGQNLLDKMKKYDMHMDSPFVSDEILCNCTDVGCDAELTRLDDRFKGLCRSRGGACKKQLTRLNHEGVIHVALACVNPDDLQPFDRPLICEPIEIVLENTNVACCANQSFCNAKLNIDLKPDGHFEKTLAKIRQEEAVVPVYQSVTVWQIAVLTTVPLIILLICVLVYVLYRNRMLKEIRRKGINPYDKSHTLLLPYEVQTVEKLLTDAMCENSGSGTGFPIFVQRTIARQIELHQEIGRGRFGEVWLGHWKGEKVAVKIFSSRDEKSWFREVEVFQTIMLLHPNLLRFIASDNKDTGMSMQLWLITEYHEHGSLFDYLIAHTVTQGGLCKMVRSIACGLAFLHSEIRGTQSKPAIAHRDLKSKNILVKNDGSCCIADLGLAVRSFDNVLDIPDNQKCGTVRYLAPEILDGTLNKTHIDGFRTADIYAFGLIIWEIARRTNDGLVEAYELPYNELQQRDPTLSEMRKHVCTENRRPIIPNRWANCATLSDMSRLMKECWARNPSARLTAMNVRNAVDRLVAAENLVML
uniref:receptor protein serine/threonine kinase n=1 Tax=Plectus sambesii TaxID=2011161 RepID=A0A914VU19_9BILA